VTSEAADSPEECDPPNDDDGDIDGRRRAGQLVLIVARRMDDRDASGDALPSSQDHDGPPLAGTITTGSGGAAARRGQPGWGVDGASATPRRSRPRTNRSCRLLPGTRRRPNRLRINVGTSFLLALAYTDDGPRPRRSSPTARSGIRQSLL